MDNLSVQHAPSVLTLSDPTQIWNTLKSIMIAAKTSCVPLKTVSKHSKPYWTDKLSELSRKVRNARRAFKFRSNFNNGDLLDAAKAEFSKALADAKNQYIGHKTNGLNSYNGTKFWQQFKHTFYSNAESCRTIGTLVDSHGNLIINDEHKAKLFHNDIFLGKHLNTTRFNQEWKLYVENENQNNSTEIASAESDLLNAPINSEELDLALKRLKANNKSADLDGIHPLMLKFCGPQFSMLLLHLFRVTLTSHVWPWNVGKVIFLRKEGKSDYRLTSSYRPITITSYVGKLLERILDSRLREYVDLKNIIPPSQHGFRQGRSTASYICEMLRFIQHNISSHKKTAGLFIDLQKAFDSVWLDGLIYRLREIGLHGHFLGVITSFLKHRKIELSINGHKSELLTCPVGVPQGSVLSPILFAIFVRDMLGSTNGLSLQYADDSSIIVTANNPEELRSKCQNSCDVLDSWLSKWRMVVNSTKSMFIAFHPCILNNAPKISGHVITQTKETKVLGLVIDSELKFLRQHQTARHTIITKWNILKPFVFQGLNISVTRKIICTTIIPAALYLSHLWDTDNKLSLYTPIKQMLHAPFYPPAEILHVLSNILPVALIHTKHRLLTTNQLLNGNPSTLQQFPKSKLSKILSSEWLKFEKSHPLTNNSSTSTVSCKIKRYTLSLWQKRWQNFLRQHQSSGLLAVLENPETLLTRNPVPHKLQPTSFGNLCAVLTGHSRLQDHKFALSLTYSPTCICLSGDETPFHYLFECTLYNCLRLVHPPIIGDWNSMVTFIEKTGRNP